MADRGIVEAGLSLVVTDSLGRTSSGSIRTDDGTVVVDVDDAAVLLASLPIASSRSPRLLRGALGATDAIADVLGPNGRLVVRQAGRDLGGLDLALAGADRNLIGRLAGDQRWRVTPHGLVTAARTRLTTRGVLAAAAVTATVALSLLLKRARRS